MKSRLAASVITAVFDAMDFFSDQLAIAMSSNSISVPSFPLLVLPKVVVYQAPGDASVQPTADLTFSYSSCAERFWILKRETKNTHQGKVTYLQVEGRTEIDCFGPFVKRDYTLQISSDTNADGQYALVNPSVLASATAE